MLKEMYLKDLELVDHKKLKGRKIVKNLLSELYINKKNIDDFNNGLLKEEDTFLMSNNSFFHKLSYVYNAITEKESTFELYKNVYDDFFVYVSNVNKNGWSKSKNDYIIFLDENNKLNFKKDNISLITCYDQFYSTYSKSTNYEIMIIAPNCSTNIHYKYKNKTELEKKYDYNECIQKENSKYVFSYGHQSQKFQRLVFLEKNKQIDFFIEKYFSSHTTINFNYTLKNLSIDGYLDDKNFSLHMYLNGDLDTSPIFSLDHSKEDEMKKEIDELQLNNYGIIPSTNIDDYLDLLILTKDIDLEVNEKAFYAKLYKKIPEIYDFLKEIYFSDSFEPNMLIKKFNTIDSVKEKIDEVNKKDTVNINRTYQKRLKND